MIRHLYVKNVKLFVATKIIYIIQLTAQINITLLFHYLHQHEFTIPEKFLPRKRKVVNNFLKNTFNKHQMDQHFSR